MPEEYLECPYCRKDNVPHGATVCQGCGAEILYGPTGTEQMSEGWLMGVFSGCACGCGCLVPLLAAVLIGLGLLKDPLESWFEFVSLITVIFMMVLFGVGFERSKGQHAHRVRFFRRNRHL